MKSDIQSLNDLYEYATEIVYSDLSWEAKYTLIFSANISKKIFDIVKSMNYYDPDTTYQEDVVAFYNVFKNYLGKN